MTGKRPPIQDDWEEPDLSHLKTQMQGLKLPPGFVPNPGEPEPSYVPNSPPGAYAPQNEQRRIQVPQNPKDIQTPEEAMAYMNSGVNAMLNPTFQNANTIKPAFVQAPVKPVEPTVANPLAKYFRTPGMYVSLPSGGAYNKGEIAFEMNNEIAVYPMTSADELLLKNPDALMSGAAVEQVIRSCVPAIKNPRSLPVADVDVLLLAVREASYGNIMEFETECPKCGTQHGYQTNIREMIETATRLEPQYVLDLGNGLFASLRPQVLASQNRAALITFQEAKKLQIIANGDIDEATKNAHINESMKRLTEMNLELTVDCIEKIITPDAEVTDSKFIMEFLKNTSRNITKAIDDALKVMNDTGVKKVKEMKCTNKDCGHEWKSDIVFDPTSFFE